MDDANLSISPSDLEQEVERLFLYSLAWSVGGRLDIDDRAKWDAYLRTVSNEMPKSDGKGKDIKNEWTGTESQSEGLHPPQVRVHIRERESIESTSCTWDTVLVSKKVIV